MSSISTEEDIDALHGQIESASLEIKGVHDDGCIKKTEDLVKSIQGLLNGSEPEGHIIIGLQENEDQEVDIGKKSPVRFPAKIRDMSFEPKNFADYRDHLMKMLRASTENLTEGLCKVNRIKAHDGSGQFLVISVSQSVLRPHRNTNGHYYIRRTEGRTDRMSTVEVEAEILTKNVRLQALQSGLEPKKNEEPKQSFRDNPFKGDKPVTTLIPWGRRENAREVTLLSGGEEFLWLTPSTPQREWLATDLKDLVHSNAPLIPFGRVTSTWHERNEFGAVVFQESAVKPGQALNLAQVFTDGRILGIDRFLLNPEKLKEFSGLETPYIPSVAFEEDFERGLKNFLRFASQTLKIPPPYNFRAGLSGIKGYAMAVQDFGMGVIRGDFLKDEVYYDGEVKSPETDVRDVLLPFFELVWSEAGLKRPTDFRSR